MNRNGVKRTTMLGLVLLCLVSGLVQGCVSTSWSMPTAARLVELGQVAPDADLESLERGRVLAIMDCRECHRQYWPQEFDAKRWPRLSRNMGKKAAMTRAQIQDISLYMVAASASREPSEGTEE